MNWHWASCSIAILALAGTSASPAPRAGNPCKQLRHSLDRQIDDLKVQQKDELQQCELSNGEGSDECLLLKDQQKQALRAMRDNRTLQMSNCSGGVPFAGLAVPIVADLNPSCVNQSYSQCPDNYPDNDEYPPKIRDPRHRHHHPHYHYPTTETAAKAGPVKKATPVSETSGGKNPHANTLTADSTGRNPASSAGHNTGGRNESAGSHSSSSLASAGGSSSHSAGASFGSSHSSGAGSTFSGASSSHSSAASSSSSSSSSSNSSGGHH